MTTYRCYWLAKKVCPPKRHKAGKRLALELNRLPIGTKFTVCGLEKMLGREIRGLGQTLYSLVGHGVVPINNVEDRSFYEVPETRERSEVGIIERVIGFMALLIILGVIGLALL